ncbi:MAG: trypsin-like peptidase domain-containing protein [Clostridia bacterium]|nr:trypsin-like peptidase domain-containing protein [Clostridia bacterium]
MKNLIKKLVTLALSVCFILPLFACDGCFEPQGNNVVLPPSNVSDVTYTPTVDKYTQNLEEASLTSAVKDVYQSVVYIENTISPNQKGRGCGVVVDIDAVGENANVYYIYTCYHVVEDFTSLKVTFPFIPIYYDASMTLQYDYANINYDTYVFTTEGNEPEVGFVGGDRLTDVAVLKVDISAFSDVTVKDGVQVPALKPVKAKVSDDYYTLGQTVFAIGNPTGELPGTVTSGVVSYINRDISVDDLGVMKLLQFDTPINAGNSGGGLFNLFGELVGIVNAGTTTYENIGFAIPTTINSPTKDYGNNDTGFVNVAKQLIETAWSDGNGNYNYGYVIGRWQLGLGVAYDSNGAPYVANIENSSVFYGTEVSVNDYIKKVSYLKNGGTVTHVIGATADKLAGDVFNDVYEVMKSDLKAGDSVTITFKNRFGSEYSVTATLKQKIYRDTGKGTGN